MKKFLYFASAAPDGTAGTEQVACFPADKLSHFEMHTATALRIYFDANQETDEDSGIDRPVVALTITSGKHKEVLKALAGMIGDGAANDGFTVVADSENSVFAHANITACASIGIVDAS